MSRKRSLISAFRLQSDACSLPVIFCRSRWQHICISSSIFYFQGGMSNIDTISESSQVSQLNASEWSPVQSVHALRLPAILQPHSARLEQSENSTGPKVDGLLIAKTKLLSHLLAGVRLKTWRPYETKCQMCPGQTNRTYCTFLHWTSQGTRSSCDEVKQSLREIKK